MRTALLFGAALRLFGTGDLAGQAKPEPAAFITRLGNDTIAVERYSRSADKLVGDLLVRSPRTRIIHYEATLGRDGTVERYESSVHLPGNPNAPPQGGVATFGPDTVTMQLHLGDSSWTVRTLVHRGAVPLANSSYALWEQMVRQAVATKQDSVGYDMVPMGSSNPQATFVVRRGQDAATVGYFGFPAMVRIDAAGRILAWDGAKTTVKVKVERLASVDLEALAQRFSAADGQGKSLGQLSPRDTVRAKLGKAHLLVDYGRPSKRGRTIFGGIVPWGEIWRTGANAATQFTTDVTLRFGQVEVPAGTYTLWSLPTSAGTKLIINRQHGQWGTEYDASQDLARVDLAADRLGAPVELFTIGLEGGPSGGTLSLVWDTTRFSVPFTIP
jgi:hypothetical protein